MASQGAFHISIFIIFYTLDRVDMLFQVSLTLFPGVYILYKFVKMNEEREGFPEMSLKYVFGYEEKR